MAEQISGRPDNRVDKGKSGARLYPLPQYLALLFWDFVRWPATVRQLKAAGARHTGFMTWEFGPEDEDPLPVCYETALGFWVHGPGCDCDG